MTSHFARARTSFVPIALLVAALAMSLAPASHAAVSAISPPGGKSVRTNWPRFAWVAEGTSSFRVSRSANTDETGALVLEGTGAQSLEVQGSKLNFGASTQNLAQLPIGVHYWQVGDSVGGAPITWEAPRKLTVVRYVGSPVPNVEFDKTRVTAAGGWFDISWKLDTTLAVVPAAASVVVDKSSVCARRGRLTHANTDLALAARPATVTISCRFPAWSLGYRLTLRSSLGSKATTGRVYAWSVSQRVPKG